MSVQEASVQPPGSDGGSLKADLSAQQLFSLAFGCVIGVSWILLVGGWISSSGSMGAILAFVLGGLLIVPIGFCYSELGQRYPATGGEYVYAYRFFGPAIGFAAAWTLILLYVAVCAFEAITVPWLALEIWPQLTGPALYQIGDRSVHLGELVIAFGATAALTWLQLSGAQLTARVQDWMVVAMILAALGFIGGAMTTGSVANLEPMFSGDPQGFISLLLLTPLFYAGFGAVPQALGESSPAALKRIPQIVFLVIIAAIVFHIVVILATALVLTPSELAAPLPAAVAFEKAFNSPTMAAGALVIGLLGLLTTWNAVYYSASRIVFALGHGRLGPTALARTSKRNGAPIAAIMLVGALSAAAIPFGKELLYPVLALGGLCVTLIFMIVTLCCLRVRLLRRAAGERVGLLFPFASLVIALGLLGLTLFTFGQQVLKGDWPAAAVLVGWVVLGGLFWAVSARTRKTIDSDERDRRVLGYVIERGS